MNVLYVLNLSLRSEWCAKSLCGTVWGWVVDTTVCLLIFCLHIGNVQSWRPYTCIPYFTQGRERMEKMKNNISIFSIWYTDTDLMRWIVFSHMHPPSIVFYPPSSPSPSPPPPLPLPLSPPPSISSPPFPKPPAAWFVSAFNGGSLAWETKLVGNCWTIDRREGCCKT